MRAFFGTLVGIIVMTCLAHAAAPATVTEAVNQVEHGTKEAVTEPATKGTPVCDGEYLKTGVQSRAEIGPAGRPVLFAYDVPKFVESSPLLNNFHSTLPNARYIHDEVQTYRALEKRGFIGAPLQLPQYWGGMPVASPPNQYDSPSQAQPGAHPPPARLMVNPETS